MDNPLFDSTHFVIAPKAESKARCVPEPMTISWGELE
jgi:hypothetical protein